MQSYIILLAKILYISTPYFGQPCCMARDYRTPTAIFLIAFNGKWQNVKIAWHFY